MYHSLLDYYAISTYYGKKLAQMCEILVIYITIKKGGICMADLKSGLILKDGEQLVMEIEAELWATSSNPFARLLGEINRVIAMIFGNRRKGFVVITNKRVVKVVNIVSCYCFNTGREVKYLLPSAVKEVSYSKYATCGCFCPAYYFQFETQTENTRIMLKGVDEEGAQKTVDAFYNAIARAQMGNE